jgi:hemoglobin/transferrin/lactoferrin receptor protein
VALHYSRSLVAIAVAAGLISPVFAAEKHTDDEVMVVSGSRIAQKLEDVSGPISVITAKQIEEQVVTDAADLFRYEPGVTVKGGGESGSDGQTFTIRGMGGNRVKVVRNGVRQNDAYSEGGVGQGYFDTDMIKQVEVVKGPASVAYGSDAMGGVIAITTKDAADFLRHKDSYFDVTGGYASGSEQVMGGFTGALRAGEFEHLLRYTERHGGITQNYQSDLDDLDIVSRSVLLKSKWNFSPDQNIKLTVDYYDQDKDSDDFTNSSVLRLKDERNKSYDVMVDHSAKLNIKLADNIFTKLYANGFDQKNNKETGTGLDGTEEYNTFKQDSIGIQTQMDKKLGVHHLVWGAEYEKTATSRIKNKITYPSNTVEDRSMFPDSDTKRAAIWLFNNIYFGERWVLTPGVRYDHYQLDATSDDSASFEGISEGQFSPKLGLVYKAHDLANLFAQYSHGFKAPTYSDALASGGYSAATGSINIIHDFIANPDLRPETSDGIDFGIRGQTTDFNYELSLFKTKYKNFIADETETNFSMTGGKPTLNMVTQYVNLDKVDTQGAEFKAGYWLTDNVHTWGSVSYITGKDGDGQYINSLSPFNGNVGVRYEQPMWNVSTAVRFADSMNKVGQDSKGVDYMTSAGWAVVDMYAQFKPLPALDINVGVFNLFDKEYVSYESVAGQAQNADVSPWTEAGRSISARVKYVF